jgi:hypothetical protein
MSENIFNDINNLSFRLEDLGNTTSTKKNEQALTGGNSTFLVDAPVRVAAQVSELDGVGEGAPAAAAVKPTSASVSELDGVGAGAPASTPVRARSQSAAPVLNRAYFLNQGGGLTSYSVGLSSNTGVSVPVRNSKSGPQINIEDTSKTTFSLNFVKDPLETNVYRADLSGLTNATGNAVNSKADLEKLLLQRGLDIKSSGMNVRRASIEYGADSKPYLRLATSPVQGTQYTLSPSITYDNNNAGSRSGWNAGFQIKLSWGGSQPANWSAGVNGGYQNGSTTVALSATAERVTATNPVLQGVYVTVPTNVLKPELQNNLLTPTNTNLETAKPSNQITR